MLTEIEFMDKKHIILDKFDTTYIMNRNKDNLWEIHSIPKDTMVATQKPELVNGSDAYEFYRERMSSFGFRPFPIIEE